MVGLKTQDNFIHSSRSSLCQLSFKYIRIQILLLGKACVETENSSSNLKSIHFNNTPEHELGSPKLFENELIDPPSNSNFDIIQVYTGFWPKLYG